MSTGSISLDILLNKILTDAISGGNESIRAIQKRYPSLSEKEAHEILSMVSATAQSNDDNISYHCGYDVCAVKQNTFVLCESCVSNLRIPSL